MADFSLTPVFDPDSFVFSESQITADYPELTVTIEHKFHKMLEACDNIQGFQISLSTQPDWLDIADQLVKYIADEVPKACIFGYLLSEKACGLNLRSRPLKSRQDSMNLAYFLSSTLDHFDLCLPMYSPLLTIFNTTSSLWNLMAPAAIAIETLSFPFRSKNLSQYGIDMSWFKNTLIKDNAKNILATSVNTQAITMALGFPENRDATSESSLEIIHKADKDPIMIQQRSNSEIELGYNLPIVSSFPSINIKHSTGLPLSTKIKSENISSSIRSLVRDVESVDYSVNKSELLAFLHSKIDAYDGAEFSL